MFKETYKPCCCDDGCESVDTQETPIAHLIYGADLQVANCVYLGKLSAWQPTGHEILKLVHSLQHIFRTFRKPSPQRSSGRVRIPRVNSDRRLAEISRKMETEGTTHVLQ